VPWMAASRTEGSIWGEEEWMCRFSDGLTIQSGWCDVLATDMLAIPSSLTMIRGCDIRMVRTSTGSMRVLGAMPCRSA